jgi:protoporphyrinogen/coproporphyrinogen III oxidase
MRIGIIGAGLSGLTTAFYLNRLRPDADLVIFDAAARAGGVIETADVDGFRFEAGPNGFLTNKPDFRNLATESGAQALLCESSSLSRKRFIYTDALHALPESPRAFLATRLLTASQKLRVAGEIFVPARRDGADETLREFGDRRLGKAFTDVFLDAMCAGIFGTTPEKVSVAAAFPVVVALEREHGGLFRGMFARRKRSAGPGGVLMSFRGGLGAFVAHLAQTIVAEWRLGEPATQIHRVSPGYRIVTGRGMSEVDRVVIATPSFVAAGLLAGLDGELSQRLAAIPYTPMAVVGFGYRGDVHPLDGFGLLTTTGAHLPVLGILWDSSVFPDRAPEGARSVRVMIGGQRNPELVSQDREGLVATARAGLAATMGLDQPADVVFVRRWERGIPSYEPGHLANVTAIEHRLAGLAGLELVGNAYRGVAMNDCVHAGRELARRMASG